VITQKNYLFASLYECLSHFNEFTVFANLTVGECVVTHKMILVIFVYKVLYIIKL